MTSDRIKQISLNGVVELGYCVHGAGPNKLPLVFVHGGSLRSTAGPYEELLELLARRYAVHAVDLRGHGASAGALAGWSLEALADDVVAFSRELALERPVFVGHSLGAFISVFAEIRHPGAFSALCLLSPGPANPTLDPVEALDFLIDEQLKDVAAPVLLICGQRDIVVPPARQHDMARKVQRSKEVIFSTEGHMLPNESAPIAAREILAFLDHDRGRLAIAA